MAVSEVQPMLSLPGDVFDLGRNRRLTLSERGADGGAVSIRPRGLDDDASKMRVTRLRDAASSDSLAGGMLTRNGAAVAHELSGCRKPGELADFRDDGHGRHHRDPAQRLE